MKTQKAYMLCRPNALAQYLFQMCMCNPVPSVHMETALLKLVFKELQHLAAILQHYPRRLIFMKHFFFTINFQEEKANTFTRLIILIMKSLQIELNSTNLLLWPPICQHNPKCNNSEETNFMPYPNFTCRRPSGLYSEENIFLGLFPTLYCTLGV